MWENVKNFLKRPEIIGSFATVIAGVLLEAYAPLGDIINRDIILALLLLLLGGGSAARALRE